MRYSSYCAPLERKFELENQEHNHLSLGFRFHVSQLTLKGLVNTLTTVDWIVLVLPLSFA
jgi:hypothetical protein